MGIKTFSIAIIDDGWHHRSGVLVSFYDVKLHHLHSHKYGDNRELTFHIRLPADMRLEDAHSIAEKLENKIREEMNIEATIHIEPIITRKKDNK